MCSLFEHLLNKKIQCKFINKTILFIKRPHMTISYVHDIKTSGQNEGVLTIIVEANVAYHAHVASCAITNP
jgi:hypothetical protein